MVLRARWAALRAGVAQRGALREVNRARRRAVIRPDKRGVELRARAVPQLAAERRAKREVRKVQQAEDQARRALKAQAKPPRVARPVRPAVRMVRVAVPADKPVGPSLSLRRQEDPLEVAHQVHRTVPVARRAVVAAAARLAADR